jgi:ribosomal protein S18 acetylase RimI-like enzyme
MALIAIAHPDHRGELLDRAKQRHYVFSDQIAPRAAVPAESETEALLHDGRKVLIRPIRITDERKLQELFYRLSNESTYQRFFHFKKTHPHQEMLSLVDPGDANAVALVASSRDDDTGTLVGMARYDVDPATLLADVAFVVDDAWQHRGLGKALMARMIEVGKSHALAGFSADVLSSNQGMLGVFHASGLNIESRREGGVIHVTMKFPPASSIPGPP